MEIFRVRDAVLLQIHQVTLNCLFFDTTMYLAPFFEPERQTLLIHCMDLNPCGGVVATGGDDGVGRVFRYMDPGPVVTGTAVGSPSKPRLTAEFECQLRVRMLLINLNTCYPLHTFCSFPFKDKFAIPMRRFQSYPLLLSLASCRNSVMRSVNQLSSYLCRGTRLR